jgi:FtsP/CotA-like multicopper oxidase with cupredoxin domain
MLVNPTILVVASSQLAVDVANRLEEPTTTHWHGCRSTGHRGGRPVGR